jgi:hypothetical protein
MTSLSLELAAHEPFDLAFDAPRFVLWRRGSAVTLSLDDGDITRVRRALAFRGVRASIVNEQVPVPPSLHRAVGTALVPARLQPSDLDLIEVRVVPLSEATARCLRRPIRGWPLRGRARRRCAALLGGTEALLEIRRTAWCARATLLANRHALRPAVFDGSATARPMRVYASERRLTRWIEG